MSMSMMLHIDMITASPLAASP
eukprot:COSAG06_NODE_27090_length_601_cov_1.292829_1_plen_21_part_10